MSMLEKTNCGKFKILFHQSVLFAHAEIRVTKSEGVVVDAVEMMLCEDGPAVIRIELIHGERHEFYGYRVSNNYTMGDLVICIAILEFVCKKVYKMYEDSMLLPCMPSLELLNKLGPGLEIHHIPRRATFPSREFLGKEGFRTVINYQSLNHPNIVSLPSKSVRDELCQMDVLLNECEHAISTTSHVPVDVKEYRSTMTEIMQNLEKLRKMIASNL